MKSDPTNPDSDYDYYLDGNDVYPTIWNKSKICDDDIDDSCSATGNNPSLNTTNNTCGKLRCVIMGKDGTQYKNEYVFERFTDSN